MSYSVRVCHADLGGVGYYRLLMPAYAISEKTDINVTYDFGGGDLCKSLVFDKNAEVDCPEDVVILTRPTAIEALLAIKSLKRQGKKVIIDMDDDYWKLDPRNPWAVEIAARPEHSLATLDLCMAEADLVTVSTPFLVQRIKNDKVVVLRNCVPDHYLDTPENNTAREQIGATVVGWTGNVATHIGDLEAIGNGLRRGVRSKGAKFLNIGSEAGPQIAGFRQGEAYISPWVELHEYPFAVNAFDVGIVPLVITDFNQAKSYLKGIEYASLGIPFIASPTDEYKLLNSHGVGEIARTPDQWYYKLRQVIDDLQKNNDSHQERVGRGLEFARANTYFAQVHQWAEAWKP